MSRIKAAQAERKTSFVPSAIGYSIDVKPSRIRYMEKIVAGHIQLNERLRPSDRSLMLLARAVGRELLRTEGSVTTAESCTGGLVAKCLTDIAGSSSWFRMGFVTYSNSSKTTLLGVPSAVIRSHGAVSRQVAVAMCRSALRRASAQIAVSITGIAGPGGAVRGKPVGTVWFGWAVRNGRKVKVTTSLEVFSGNRDAVRRKSAKRALEGVLGLVQKRHA